MKELHCKDVGFACEAVVRAETEEEVLRQGAEHARTAHGMKTLDADTIAKIRSKIRTN